MYLKFKIQFLCYSTSLCGAEAWLSQLAARFYVCVPFSGQQPSVTFPQNKELGSDVMLIPFRSHYIYIMGTIISNIVIVGRCLLVGIAWLACSFSDLVDLQLTRKSSS